MIVYDKCKYKKGIMNKFFLIGYFCIIIFGTTIAYHLVNNDSFMLKKADLLFEKGEFDNALLIYINSKVDFNDSLEHKYRIIDCFIKTGHKLEAEKYFLDHIYDGNISHDDILIAKKFEEHGLFNISEKIYSEFLKKNPDSRTVRIFLSRVLGKQKKYEKAVKNYRLVLMED